MKRIRNYHLRTERWKDVEGYEGLYQVSNFGRVRSLDHYITIRNGGKALHNGKIMIGGKSGLGYRKVTLCKDGVPKGVNLHRLVAQTFIPNPNNLPEVNHKDENKVNNCRWNLEWCPVEYNRSYGNRNNKAQKTRQRKYGKSVLQYTLDGQFVAEYSCLREAERQTGVYHSHISDCCKGVDCQGFNIKQAGGYIWRYRE